MNHTLEAPIVAVTVYPDRARITRRGAVRLGGGEQRVHIEPLPLALDAESVRVSGHGPATVLGVDVLRRQYPRTSGENAVELDRQRRAFAAELAEVTDADEIAQQRLDFIGTLTQRAGATYARALAAGTMQSADVAGFGEALTAQLAAIRAERRDLAVRRERIQEELAAVERRIALIDKQFRPDRMAVEVGVDVTEDGADIELELSYVVSGAQWQSTYDIRLDGDTLSLTWFGMVTQGTGEDWPECELQLSTARPSGAVEIPELDPWYLDRYRPPVPYAQPSRTRGVGFGAAAGAADEPLMEMSMMARMPELDESVATLEQGVAAATYRPRRPVAVPGDGAAHRTTVAVLDMAARLDYVTAPVEGPEAHLRATATNSTEHTVLPGKASVFHGGEFVGSTQLAGWAPGEEVELALGVDDRIRVDRELVRRGASKTALRDTRRRELEYRVTVANHTPRPSRISVLDQLPVSRDESITVRELRLEPAPTERTEMGVLTWLLELAPGESREIRLGLRVELAKGVEMIGWRE